MTTKGGDFNLNEIAQMDKQIEILMDCKPLPETEVKTLCEKVCYPVNSNRFMSLLYFNNYEPR